MDFYWSPIIKKLTPYVPGEQPQIPGLIKLNTNENPYGPSPKVLQAIQEQVTGSLRLYPDPNANALKDALADYYSKKREQVFVGNGSDEVLAHVFLALLKHDLPVIFPDITYSFYPVYCHLFDIEYETVPLDQGFEVDLQQFSRPNGGIILANPNAPTGCLLSLAEIEALMQSNTGSIVVLDEAYIDFGGESAVALIDTHPNLLVIQTLSKSRSLAGLRVGFALGQPALIEALERVKNSFNSYPLDRLAIAGAVAAIQDEDHFQKNRRAIMQSRDTLATSLRALGFEVPPSAANFLFARHPDFDAAWISKELRKRSIIVRHFKQPRIEQFLRISVGTDLECSKLIQALQEILPGGADGQS